MYVRRYYVPRKLRKNAWSKPCFHIRAYRTICNPKNLFQRQETFKKDTLLKNDLLISQRICILYLQSSYIKNFHIKGIFYKIEVVKSKRFKNSRRLHLTAERDKIWQLIKSEGLHACLIAPWYACLIKQIIIKASRIVGEEHT